jgi:hypothetical protein
MCPSEYLLDHQQSLRHITVAYSGEQRWHSTGENGRLRIVYFKNARSITTFYTGTLLPASSMLRAGVACRAHLVEVCLVWRIECPHMSAGYGGDLTPNPDCILLNAIITLQTICSLLLDYSMLGLVYARCVARYTTTSTTTLLMNRPWTKPLTLCVPALQWRGRVP